MTLSKTLLGTALLGVLGALAPWTPAGEPTAAEGMSRIVVDRLAIETVKERYRTGSGSGAAVDARAVRRSVGDTLRLTTALERRWGETITPARLQAELERMARDTRAPGRLAERFAAVGQDGVRAAEALARPALVERLARAAYAQDRSLHQEIRRRARRALTRLRAGERPESLPGDLRGRVVSRTLLRSGDDGADGADGDRAALDDPFERRLEPAEWSREIARWRRSLGAAEGVSGRAAGGGVGALPTGRWTGLQEARGHLWTESIVAAEPNRLKLRRVIWDKRPFDAWWARARGEFPPARPLGSDAAVELPRVRAGQGAAPVEAVADDAPAGSWEALYRSPQGRRGHVAVWTGAEMIVWGGFVGGVRALRDGALYDPVTATWEPLPFEGAPSPRYGATSVWTGSEMIVWGGRDGFGAPLGDGGAFDPVSRTWRELPSVAAPEPRYDHTAVWTGSEMIIWGGRAATASPLRSGAAYDPDDGASGAWSATPLGDTAPAARFRHAAVWAEGRMVVWGGVGEEGAFLEGGGRLDPAAGSWAPVAAQGAPGSRAGHSAVWTGERVLIWGGEADDGRRFGDGAAYDPIGDAWSALPADGAPGARFDHTAVWTGSEMIVWGGSAPGGAVGDGGAYSPSENAWRPLEASDLSPAPRVGHTAVWAPIDDADVADRMIVWGGETGLGTVLNTGGGYDPQADGWSPTPATEPVSRHTAVWTGSEMIVWGGTDGIAASDDGESYDPAADTWTPLPAGEDVPAPRTRHTAVWTGTEMIVWGGLGADEPLDSGGAYEPGTGWRPINADQAPSNRFGHTAVWTGTEMIVWGGRSSPFPFADGGRYDPEADTWTPVTDENPPLPRTRHTAVWTGTEMVVWGGRSATDDLGGGGRYDPVADAWAATDTAFSPEPRRDHVAAWSGQRMLIWGGYGDVADAFLQSGWEYDPERDDWSRLPLDAETPPGRSRSEAVFNGRELVFWGGERFDPVRGGGRYNPFEADWKALEPAPEGIDARVGHTAVWSDRGLIVWGGENGGPLNDGGVYTVEYTWFRDADGDGFGDPDETAGGIVAPDGFVGSPDDCDDTDAAVFPGGREINDGRDNQCPGERGFGVVDENTGASGFADPEEDTVYSWEPQEGATDYAVARASDPQFTTGCDGIGSTGGDTQWVDPDEPDPGRAFYYLNRPIAPNLGSWGQDSSLNERTGPCL